MSLLSVTFGRNKERKKSVIGVDLGIVALDIGVYGKSDAKEHSPEHNGEHPDSSNKEHPDNSNKEHSSEQNKEHPDNSNHHEHTTSDNIKTSEGSPINVSITPEIDCWKCRYHNSNSHDLFISYRVNTDAELAEKLVDRIHLQNWQTSFLNGLLKSSVVVLLMSRSGIENFKAAHERHDNMLLEYEYALQRLSEEGAQKIKLIPVFVGRKISVVVDGVEMEVFQKFQFPNLLDFPDEPHKTTHEFHVQQRKKLTIREVMKHIFSLQGVFLNDISNLTGLVSELNEILEKGEHRTV